MNYTLINAVERHQQNPTTFEIPDAETIQRLDVGYYAKIGFEGTDESSACGERMWVKVLKVRSNGTFEGALANDPVVIEGLTFGDRVTFARHNILDVTPPHYHY